MAISGRVPLLVLLGVVPTIMWPQPLTVIGWVVLVVIVSGMDLLAAVRPELLQFSRELPPSVRLSETTTSTVTVLNPTRRQARVQVRDAWPPSATPAAERPLLRVNPGSSLRQLTELTPTRRGDLAAAALTVRSFGPLRLAARQRSLNVPGVLRVLPEFRSRSHLPSRLARLRELDGQASVQVRGQGTEFDSLREYAAGDDVRSIDWRATARATRTMVRTWRPERDRHVLMMLDSSRWAAGRIGGAGNDQLRLDAGIEACLLMAALGSASGDRMSLLVADAEVRQRLAGTAKGSALAAFADRLSLAEAELTETDWSMVAAQVNQLCRQRSLVVLITGLDPALYAEGLGTVLGQLAHSHQIVIAHVTDPTEQAQLDETPDANAAYDAAASARLWLATQALSNRVHRMGVEVVHADPDHLAPAVCDTYLALKATGRL
ncbi:MAG TPA: DUF58 domain-containing protein [Propionibacteriaceae bacterium]|nr:DUF58 domain-containing protein [Propionibacteriaceae bacterium]